MIRSEIALKEWAAVTEALSTGKQFLLVRKGGIRDPKGSFRLEHKEFFLYPTLEHQSPELLRPEFRALVRAYGMPDHFLGSLREPSTVIALQVFIEVVFCAPIREAAQMAGLEKYHIWTPQFFEKRLLYKPAEPALLVVARAYRLTKPAEVPVLPEYAGCKSWVKLAQPVETALPAPVIEERAFQEALRQIAGRFPGEQPV